jgi:hypothetical protein
MQSGLIFSFLTVVVRYFATSGEALGFTLAGSPNLFSVYTAAGGWRQPLWPAHGGLTIDRPMTDLLIGSRPALPWRGVVGAGVLFAGCLALAGQMSQSRAAAGMGSTLEVKELGLRVTLPRGARVGEVVNTRLGLAFPIYGRTAQGAEFELVVRRVVRDRDESAGEVCRRVLNELVPIWLRPFGRMTLPAAENVMGPWPAFQVFDRRIQILLRAATPADQPAVVASLVVRSGTIDEATYRLFDRFCGKIRPAG